MLTYRRGVAQPGRVLAWGARGRRFKSCHPDHPLSLTLQRDRASGYDVELEKRMSRRSPQGP